MKREMEFKMELHYEIKAGDQVTVEESYLQNGSVVYYTIIPAIAMSGNFRRSERLMGRTGTVKEVRQDGVAYRVLVEFDCPES